MASSLFLIVFMLYATASRAISINVPRQPPNHDPLDSTVVTSKVLRLQRPHMSNKVPRRRFVTTDTGDHDALLVPVEAAQGYAVPVTIGSETRSLIVDTGSSDTWVARTSFRCINVTTQKTTAEANCIFGKLFSPQTNDRIVPGYNFNVTYASGETLVGEYYKTNVNVAGIRVPDQQIAEVRYAAWYGDGISSGVLGMAYPSLTRSYDVVNPAKDNSSYLSPYSSIFNTMTTSGLALPFFSLAIERGSDHGGYLAFDGVPPVNISSPFISTPIELLHAASNSSLSFYTIRVDGLTPTSEGGVVGNTNFQAIVDSGTTIIYVPRKISDAINAQFQPPATYSVVNGVYSVSCNASAPTIGVVINRHRFKINPMDMLYPTEIPGECFTGVAPSNRGLSVLGAVFLRNVLAVFDIGSKEMRFATREDY